MEKVQIHRLTAAEVFQALSLRARELEGSTLDPHDWVNRAEVHLEYQVDGQLSVVGPGEAPPAGAVLSGCQVNLKGR